MKAQPRSHDLRALRRQHAIGRASITAAEIGRQLRHRSDGIAVHYGKPTRGQRPRG